MALVTACVFGASASVALADSSTIAGAPTVVPGQQEFGNLATVAPEDDGCYTNAFWLLPEAAGDAITIDWEAQDGITDMRVFPSGTNDYSVGNAEPIQEQSLNDNNRNELTFRATSDGVLPVQFHNNHDCVDAGGPYDFTVSIAHDLVLSLAPVPAALNGAVAVSVHSPDGAPLTGPPIVASLQVSANGVPWTTVGQATPSAGTATIPFAVPGTLAGKSVRFRAVASGAGYLTETSSTQSVKLPAAVVTPVTPPTTPAKKKHAPAKWPTCKGWRYTPGPAISYVRGTKLTCRQIKAAIGRAQLTGKPHWVRRGPHWGLRGGRGVGHYGIKIRGFHCKVVHQLRGGRGQSAETNGMNVSCSSGARKFGFVWASWIPRFAGASGRIRHRTWGAIR